MKGLEAVQLRKMKKLSMQRPTPLTFDLGMWYTTIFDVT